MVKVYPKYVKEFIYKNYIGTGYQKMADMLLQEFGIEYTASQIKGYYHNHKLNSGLDGRFKKGRIPTNKGKKGIYAPGCEKTWFKKGHTPVNHKKIGSERITRDGYKEIKVAEPNKWRLKHRVIWEAEHGSIPKRHVLIFLDRDKTNVSLSNLKLISNKELLVMNRQKLFYQEAELNEVSSTIAKVIVKSNALKKGVFK